MRARSAFVLGGLAIATMQLAFAQAGSMTLPKTVEAGTAFEDLPDGWTCPDCGVGKEEFEPVED